MNTHVAFTGNGQHYTKKNSNEEYPASNYEEYFNSAFNPPSVPKANGPWWIWSNYRGHDARGFDIQKDYGLFGVLWADIDEGDPTQQQVAHAVRAVLEPGTHFLIHHTASTGEVRDDGTVKEKHRIIVPLAVGINGRAYQALARTFNKQLALQGLIPDSVNTGTAQLCYGPNRGPRYDAPHTEGSTFWHPGHSALGPEIQAEYDLISREDAERSQRQAQFGGKVEGNRSHLRAFRLKHKTLDLLELYGFETKNGRDWHHPSQSGISYATELFDDGGLYTLSSTVGSFCGTLSGKGWYLDGFDLYTHFSCGGNAEVASQYARQCLQEQEDARYGAATVKHGEEIFAAMFVGDQPLGPLAHQAQAAQREAEQKVVQELQAEAKTAERQRWGGEWTKDVPFPIEPTKLEWLAWHAPGGIGEAVRAKSVQTARHSLVPAMLGATTLFMHLGQGKFVTKVRHFVTPCAQMIFQVGSSGSGKGDGTGTFYELLNLLKDKHGIPADRVKTFASGQSMTDYLMHKNRNVTIIQNEGGADRKAGKGSTHFESLMAVVTDAYTSFTTGIERTHTKSDDQESTQIMYPTISALQSSTPKKLFSSIDGADSESGWLGRFLFIKLPSTRTNKAAADTVHWPASLIARMEALCGVLPPLPGVDHPGVWHGDGMSFHYMPFTPEGRAMMDSLLDKYDDVALDERRGEGERAIYARAFEAVGRLAAVAGLSKDRKVDAECITWATMVVDSSLEYVTSQMENSVEVDSYQDTPTGRIRRCVHDVFNKVEVEGVDGVYAKKLGGKLAVRKGPDGEVQVALGKLRRKVKDNSCQRSALVTEELDEMIKDGELVEVTGLDLAHKAKWLKLIKW